MEQEHPKVVVGALILNKEGKIFLMKSHKWKNKYVVPGGHVELGEKLVDAVKREVKEETNLEVEDIEPIQFQEFIFEKYFWKKRHFIFFDFACKTDSTKVRLNEEAQDYGWFSLKEALKLDVEPFTLKTIKKYIKEKKLRV